MRVLSEDLLKPSSDFLRLNAPEGPALTIALRKLHEFRQAANYAILGGK